jgi:integrase
MLTTCSPPDDFDLRPMLLSTLVGEYLSEREVSPLYAANLRRAVTKAAAYGIQTVKQLDPKLVNDFLANYPLSTMSRHNLRREFVTVWRYAYDRGLTDVYPSRVRKIPAPKKPVQTWSIDYLRQLLAVAEKDTTPISMRFPWMRRCDVLPAWIALGYDSGLRFTDVLSTRRADFRNHTVAVTAHKTKKVTVRKITPFTEGLCQKLLDRSPDDTLFRWLLPRRRALVLWRQFLDANAAPGSSRWLRRSGATYVERKQPGAATRFLGHSNPTLARISYIDETLLDLPDGPPPLR